MQEILMTIITEHLPLVSHAVLRGLVIFIMSLGMVYMTGRMLGLVHTYRSRNAIAIMSMIVFSYLSIEIYDLSILVHPLEVYWRTAVYTFLSVIFYVLIGFDLYDRFNAWCDKKFGKGRKNGPKK